MIKDKFMHLGGGGFWGFGDRFSYHKGQSAAAAIFSLS